MKKPSYQKHVLYVLNQLSETHYVYYIRYLELAIYVLNQLSETRYICTKSVIRNTLYMN